jgi:DNA-binding transcriptional ArsR family regulator
VSLRLDNVAQTLNADRRECEQRRRANRRSTSSGALDGRQPDLYNHTVMELTGYKRTTAERLDATFAALADPTRRAILSRLSRGEVSVTALAAPFDMSQPAISKHLKVLERAGLVVRSRDAQRRPVRVDSKPLDEAAAWLDGYRRTLDANVSRFDSLLESMKAARGLKPRAHSRRHAPDRARHTRKDD